jgi:hypothetical protein
VATTATTVKVADFQVSSITIPITQQTQFLSPVAVAVVDHHAPVKATSVEPAEEPQAKTVQPHMTVKQHVADAVVARPVRLLFQQTATLQFQDNLPAVFLLTTVAVAAVAGGVVQLELTPSPTQWAVEAVAQATLTLQRQQTQFLQRALDEIHSVDLTELRKV